MADSKAARWAAETAEQMVLKKVVQWVAYSALLTAESWAPHLVALTAERTAASMAGN